MSKYLEDFPTRNLFDLKLRITLSLCEISEELGVFHFTGFIKVMCAGFCHMF